LSVERRTRPEAVVIGVLTPRTIAWGVLWFFVVVVFTAGVGIISSASAVGEMPPLTPGVRSVVDQTPAGPSSAPSPGTLRAG
jgi:hypothetical protein